MVKSPENDINTSMSEGEGILPVLLTSDLVSRREVNKKIARAIVGAAALVALPGEPSREPTNKNRKPGDGLREMPVPPDDLTSPDVEPQPEGLNWEIVSPMSFKDIQEYAQGEESGDKALGIYKRWEENLSKRIQENRQVANSDDAVFDQRELAADFVSDALGVLANLKQIELFPSGEQEAAQRFRRMQFLKGMDTWQTAIYAQLQLAVDLETTDFKIAIATRQAAWDQQRQLESAWQQVYGVPRSGASGIVPEGELAMLGAIQVEDGLTVEETVDQMVQSGSLVLGQKYYFVESRPDIVDGQYRLNHIQVTKAADGGLAVVGHFASFENNNWGWTPRVIRYDSNGARKWSEKVNRRSQDFNAFDGAVQTLNHNGKECFAVTYCVRSENYDNSEVLVRYFNAANGVPEGEETMYRGLPGDFLDYTTAGEKGTRDFNHWTVFLPNRQTLIRWAEYSESQNRFVVKSTTLDRAEDTAVQFAQFIDVETINGQPVGVFAYANFGTEEMFVVYKNLATGQQVGDKITVFNWKNEFLDPARINPQEIMFRVATIARTARYKDTNNQWVYGGVGTVLHDGKAQVKFIAYNQNGQVIDGPKYLGGPNRHQVKVDIAPFEGNFQVKLTNNQEITVNKRLFAIGNLTGTNDQSMKFEVQVAEVIGGRVVLYPAVAINDTAMNLHSAYTGDMNHLFKQNPSWLALFTDAGNATRGQDKTRLVENVIRYQLFLPILKKHAFIIPDGAAINEADLYAFAEANQLNNVKRAVKDGQVLYYNADQLDEQEAWANAG